MKNNTSSRRKFITNSSLALSASFVSLASCSDKKSENKINSPNINFNKKYKWKMVTTWPPNFPVLGEGCNILSKWINKMSGGRLEIKVYGGGELIPSLECFDAVSSGAIEMGSGASYYWAGKVPACQFFSSVPFGMNPLQMNAWLISGGGNDLYKELYDPFDLIPFPGGNTSMQMGGWFNKEINSIQDLKGLKMRIPGFGGKVLSKVGGSAVTVAGGEIYTNLERGVIDATEWIGPYHDYLMGFYQVAKYYYYPGWHEPGGVLEMIVNKKKFYNLPSDLQEIIIHGIEAMNTWMLCECDSKNSIYLNKLIKEKGVILKQFPEEVIKELKRKTNEVIDELVSNDEKSKKVFQHYKKFRESIQEWSAVSDKMYYTL